MIDRSDASILQPAAQIPTDAGAWSKFVDHYGVPLVLLGVCLWTALSMAKWMRPRADRVIEGLLTNNERLPSLLQAMTVHLEDLSRESKAQTSILDTLARQQQQLANEFARIASKDRAA